MTTARRAECADTEVAGAPRCLLNFVPVPHRRDAKPRRRGPGFHFKPCTWTRKSSDSGTRTTAYPKLANAIPQAAQSTDAFSKNGKHSVAQNLRSSSSSARPMSYRSLTAHGVAGKFLIDGMLADLATKLAV